MIGRIAIAAAALAAAWSVDAAAQGLALGTGNQPIAIEARDGIEWHRDQQRYVARGEAKATQGTTSVSADTLTAYYRPKPDGGTDVFRLEAEGNVVIATPNEQSTADRAIYDVDQSVLVLTGRDLRVTTQTAVVTAKDSLEYWEKRQLIVARGDAVVSTEDKRMRADVLTAYLAPPGTPPTPRAGRTPRAEPAAQTPAAPAPAGQTPLSTQRLDRVEGFGQVHVSTATDIARAERGAYNPRTGIAVLAGNVRLTRGENQLNGDYAEVNLNTGVSRILTRPPADGGAGRVRGVFTPQDKDKEGAQPRPAAPR